MPSASAPPADASPPTRSGAAELAREAAHERATVLRELVKTLTCGALLAVAAGIRLSGAYPPEVADLCALAGGLPLALPILAEAWGNLRTGRLNLHELIALSILAGFSFEQHLTAGALALFATLGELVEERTALGAREAIQSLVELTPTRARRRLPQGGVEEVPAAELRAGDVVHILPGDRVPADGRIVKGASALEEQAITGESLPAEKEPGDEVFAGTLNRSGALEVEVARAGEDTTLSRVRELILAAEQTRIPVARIIDRVITSYLPLTLGLAAIVLFFTRDADRFLAVLVIAGPSALVLATPSATVAALSAAARLGVLIKDARDLELACRVTEVLFDKTGTLTRGRLSVTRLVPAAGLSAPGAEPAQVEEALAEALQLGASLAARSTHPAAQALVAVAAEAELPLLPVERLVEVPGRGLEGEVAGCAVLVGRDRLLSERGVALGEAAAELEGAALSLLHVALDGRAVAHFALEDTPRPEAPAAVAALRAAGVDSLVLFSGDRRAVAERVAREVGCDGALGECLPEDKLARVHAARARGERVAVVGDGVNDGPALAAADLGIAMGAGGSDLALGSARVALLQDDLSRLPFLLELSRRTRAVVIQNLVAALLTIGVGLALAGAGHLAPVPAMILHNAGDLFVLFNSARLLRVGEELLEPVA